MVYLATAGLPFAVPEPVAARSGALLSEAEGHVVRLARWVPGEPLARARKEDPKLARSVGEAVGSLAAALDGFRRPALARELNWDIRRAPEIAARHLEEIDDARRRDLLARRLAWLAEVWPAVGGLQTGVVHNDANDWNILVSDGRVSGLLDFGDMLESVQVAEPAVAVAYAMLGTDDPLGVADEVIAGFVSRFPLGEKEAGLVLPLALARLCASVCLAAHQRRVEPANAYLSVSEDDAWALLERLDLLDRRKRLLGPSLSLSYRTPLTIIRSEGAFLYDERGRRYLDCVNNVAHVGHSHPRVVEAAARQAAVLNTNTRYLHEMILEYAERLTATFPAGLDVCFFVCSGSEANELALRLARTYTGRRDVAVLDGAYHGNTSSLIEISPFKFAGPGGTGKLDWVHVAPTPDPRRGDASWYAERLRAAIAGRPLAAFFAEPIMSVAGQVVPPPGFLRAAFAAVREAGGVCVADEIQVGFGRVGESFWGFELDGAVPDIVTLGKPIGNGHPLGAVVTTRAIADAFANGMEYFSTFGGNPVSCAVGLAVLDVLRDEGLQERARSVGSYLMERLRAVAERHELLSDVRGHGLFLGIELRDRAAQVVERAKAQGVLLSTDGPRGQVLKIKPPLVFGTQEADRLVETLDGALAER